MKKRSANIFLVGWRLLVRTGPTWNRIATSKKTASDMRKHYVFPWLVLCVLSTIFFDCIYQRELKFDTILLNSIITAISLGGGYFFANTICYWYLKKHQPSQHNALSSEKIVCYSFTLIYVLKIITTAIPSLFFLQILSIYTAYLVWEACRAVLHLEEEERGNIVTVFTLVIIFSPQLINKIIYLILPNA